MRLNIQASPLVNLFISKEQASEILENQFDSKVVSQLVQNKEWFYGKRRFFSDFFSDFARLVNNVDFSNNNEIDKSIIEFNGLMLDRIVVSARAENLFCFFSNQTDGIPVFDEGVIIDILFTKRLLPAKSLQIAMDEKPTKTYIMQDARNGIYKIGKSTNPKTREKTLQSEVPLIKMILICDSNVEKELHFAYAEKRVRGEWFQLTENDILDIVIKYGFKDA